jgi:hypothetical protein
MTPALITVGFRYKLEATEPDRFLLKLYNDCLQQFQHEEAYLRGNGVALPNDFKQFPLNYQQALTQALNGLVTNFGLRTNTIIPILSDESGQMKFKSTAISFAINEANTQTNTFTMNLFFTTEVLSLIGTVADKLLIVYGDKSAEITSGQEMQVAFVKHTSDIWFQSYKKI